ncbi:MAG: DUF1638 domain-containing protein [Candidatus Thiodiazotropha sp. (ex Dulcina madagascariensis)]|nr:DUF1638 domain-containing protein [Candidatus Thiodiazotropha sp. (ex Dulcina madagascariensis)]MCU7926120.1 DUF1638 domain-containing protein [Candidatus Thiodiazotropha sp. (ex Dulcina madagascariensis)]
MQAKLCLLSCEYFRNELETVLQEEHLDEVELITFPGNCDHPLTDTGILEDAMARSPTAKCAALGGGCLSAVSELLKTRGCQVETAGNCFELLAEPSAIQSHLDEGAHLIIPGMLNQWRESFKAWDFSEQQARKFFTDSTTRLVLLDTGVGEDAATATREMARELGIPWESMPMGLGRLRLQLHRIVTRWRLDSLRKAEHQLADYAMIHDLISTASTLADEELVIEQVMELFNMLCAPGQLIYLPLDNGNSGKLHTAMPISDEDEIREHLVGQMEAYQMNEDGKGFQIVIERNEQRLGILLVQRVAFPEYSERYLNLALTITPTIALAISNARTFQQQLLAEAKVKVLNDELKQRLIAVDALNKELESFTYSVSHDLRGPLHSLDGFSNILLRDYHQRMDERGKRYLDRLRANAQRMGQLIDDLLRLSRLTRVELVREPVDLSGMVRELAADLSETSPDRQVEFRIEEGLTVDCDPSLMKVVLENLIGNAWKYTSKEETAVIEFGRDQHEEAPTFLVRDSGDGFDMSYADKLFLPFQRLHTEEEFPGNGIGLATVQRIILRHGGRIWAEAQPGKGASFYFTLEYVESA